MSPAGEGALAVRVAGRSLLLLAQKAVLLPDTRTLLIADAHIGKAASFRALGVPVPRGTTSATLGLLSELVARHAAQRIVFLGDFLHSASAHAAATQVALADWRASHAALALTLVRGNHDDRAGDPPAGLGFEVVDEPLPLDGWLLCHHPRPRAAGYVLAGHTHPCVSISGRGRDRLRLPCFHFGAEVGVLPAFGAFTGMHAMPVGPGQRVFAIAGDEVRELPS